MGLQASARALPSFDGATETENPHKQASHNEQNVLALVSTREHLAALNELLADAPFPVL